MCIMWMPANLLSQGIVDKNDKILFKNEKKNAVLEEESTKQRSDSKIINDQTDKKASF